ncbi:MAG: pyruvate kinase [Candidatus Moranbacteria bacterium]|nr:pyruvate kinase [Candidatus Moranbacteria bacterium]
MIKKTKIVVSLGPVSQETSVMTKLLRAGMNVARLNFSHGNHEEHQERLNNLRQASKQTHIPVAILQDLGGPKIRTGDFENGEIMLKKGSFFTFSSKKIQGTPEKCFISYTDLWKEVKKGQIIFLDDGKKSLQVISVKKEEVYCKVIAGGIIKSRRGVNIPNIQLKKISSLTAKDKKDLEFGIKNNVDFFALSFVQNAKDIQQLRSILNKRNSSAHIIAKIETTSAVKNIDEIIQESDGIMIARGDLAVEIPPQDVPLIQKEIITKCNRIGKPVIVATQMLASMVSSPRPSRAEVSDVANSILDGADAIMLSDETTIGEYPVETVSIMKAIAEKIEETFLSNKNYRKEILRYEIDDAVSHSAIKVAEETGARHIIALTESGRTARLLSRFRPTQSIIVLSPHEQTRTQILLNYGCVSYDTKPFSDVFEALDAIRQSLVKYRIAKKGEVFILVAGIPFGKSGATNTIMVQKI